jgi:hypothetical protein
VLQAVVVEEAVACSLQAQMQAVQAAGVVARSSVVTEACSPFLSSRAVVADKDSQTVLLTQEQLLSTQAGVVVLQLQAQ